MGSAEHELERWKVRSGGFVLIKEDCIPLRYFFLNIYIFCFSSLSLSLFVFWCW